MNKKVELGQFFTKSDKWLFPQIREFINARNWSAVVDPFAGEGDLLKQICQYYTVPVIGYDIDPALSWQLNDSLIKIPVDYAQLCITNPPYLSKSTASRFNRASTKKYFDMYAEYDDLYLIALMQCMQSFTYGVAIVPETYVLSSKFSKRVNSISIVEVPIFTDTEFPVVIITWTPEDNEDINVYKDSTFLGKMSELRQFNLAPIGSSKIKFNDINGNIGIICIDKGDNIGGISFVLPEKISSVIKHSSRTSTKVMMSTNADVNVIISLANKILAEYRKNTHDIFMAPFKGNDKSNRRRRRLDFQTARAILEKAELAIKLGNVI